MPRFAAALTRFARVPKEGVVDRLPWPDAARIILVVSLLAWTLILAAIL
jgi:hypothetical protein